MKKPSRRQRKKPTPTFQTFILEPILTPSGLVDAPGDDTPDPSLITDLFADLDGDDLTETPDDLDLDFPEEIELVSFFGNETPESPFNAGVFTVADSGQVGIDFLYDGGGYKGELAIFSLEGMEDFDLGSEEFIEEAARRALTNSTEGHIVIQDATEGAKFESRMPWESNFNSGEYKGVKTVEMNPGETFGVMLVPRGTVQQVFENPDIGGATRPLFSMETANPNDAFHVGQIADVTGDGNTFVMEDMRVDGWTDQDYNDIIFQVRGATAEASLIDDVIDADRDWRFSDTGKALIEYAEAYVEPPNEAFEVADVPRTNQTLVGIIDTGFAENNPDLDYSNITLGRDWVDGDDNPLLAEAEGNEHGTHILGIIAAQRDNDIGIDGINPDAPLWVGRAVGSGQWANSLVEFVDAAIESGQPNAVVNLSMDLTEVDAGENVTTRYEFTPMEREAIEYARQNNVMLVVAAGNDGGVMSVLGQAAQEFDNIMTVGAAEQFEPETSAWKGADRTDYSSYGNGLDVMAYGGTTENPQLSLTGEGTSGMAGTSVATAKVTGAVSQVWAANPELSYRQVVEIIRNTATDLGSTGHDAETGAGLLNMTAAVHLAKVTKPKEHNTPALLSPETWSGEGVFTPGERAVQHVVVLPEDRRQYHGWLDSSNPADTFSFQLDEPTRFASSLDFPGNLVLRRNGRVIEEGSYAPDASPAARFIDAGMLNPGNYTLKVDRGNLSQVSEYKLIMNFIEGSVGQEMPVVEWLPAKPVAQPQPTPTPSPSPEEIAAKKRAADKVRAVYEANRQRLGNSRREIQIFEQAFNGVNMPAVQYFDGGYIIWNGQKAIPYFTGTGNALPNIDLPSTVKPIWDVVKPSNVVNVPDGRHTYPNMRGSSEYWVELDGNKNNIHLAARNTSLAHPDLRTTVYRDLGWGRLQQVPLTDINSDDNYLNYKDLPPGKYLIKVDIEQSKGNVPYEMVVNLDQAGSYFSKPDPLGMLPYNFGNIGGKRDTFNDHLGAPNGDIDAYRFTTDGVPRQLMLAVRDQKGTELVNSKVTVGLFDAKNRPVSYKVVNGIIEANLKPNSQYYIKMTAKPGVGTNYQLVANLLAQSSPLQVPPGRHEYNVNISTHDVLGNKLHNSYNFKLENTGTLNWAIRDTTLKQGDFNFTLYKDGRQWGSTLKPQINEPLQFKDLPSGNYQVRVNVTNSSKNGSSYKTVFNLDQAGQTLAQARNLGKLTDQKGRLIVNDHVGMPTGDLDYYKFSTDSNQRLLRFAVRHPSGNESLPLEGNVEFILYDKNGKPLKTVNSANKKSIYGEYDLEANSEYYVRVKAHSGNLGNYQLVLNGEVKRTLETPLHNNPTNANPLRGFKDPLNGAGYVSRDRHGSPGNRSYYAVDFAVSIGTPIYAMRSGKVISIRESTPDLNPWEKGYTDNGNYVLIEHDNGYRSLYLHLKHNGVSVSPGQIVNTGDLIAYSGHNGVSTGPHLHVEVNVPYPSGFVSHYGPTKPFVIDGRTG